MLVLGIVAGRERWLMNELTWSLRLWQQALTLCLLREDSALSQKMKRPAGILGIPKPAVEVLPYPVRAGARDKEMRRDVEGEAARGVLVRSNRG